MDIQNIQSGKRLDKFLTEYLEQYSRTQIQKLIVAGNVLVNGEVGNKKYLLEEGDKITVNESELPSLELFKFLPNPEVKFEVLHEADDYIVIHKPIHMVMHPANAYEKNDTLASGLLARYPELEGVGEDPIRPGIVHRLDRNVSGVVVIARTQEMFYHLKYQFQNRLVFKQYAALVHGVFTETEGDINFGIERSTKEYTKMGAVPAGQGKDCLTQYEVVQQFQHYALVQLQLHTGRTHQLRVHMNAISHPIIGDHIYVPRSLKSRLQPDRICLHAEVLRFRDLKDQEHEFSTPIDPDMQSIIDHLYTTL